MKRKKISKMRKRSSGEVKDDVVEPMDSKELLQRSEDLITNSKTLMEKAKYEMSYYKKQHDLKRSSTKRGKSKGKFERC